MALRIVITISATIVSVECSFSVLKKVKNVLHVTLYQDKLSSLGSLGVEQELTTTLILTVLSMNFQWKNPERVHCN